MDAANQYRAKAWECLAIAEVVNDPVHRVEILRFARMWMDLAEPMIGMPGLEAVSSPSRRLCVSRYALNPTTIPTDASHTDCSK